MYLTFIRHLNVAVDDGFEPPQRESESPILPLY